MGHQLKAQGSVPLWSGPGILARHRHRAKQRGHDSRRNHFPANKHGAPGNSEAPKPDKSRRGSFVLLQLATQAEDDSKQAEREAGHEHDPPGHGIANGRDDITHEHGAQKHADALRASKGRRGTGDEMRGHDLGARRPQHGRHATTGKAIQDNDDDVHPQVSHGKHHGAEDDGTDHAEDKNLAT